MKLLKSILAGALACAVAVPATMRAQSEPEYMRSSLYTILVKSEKQNAALQKQLDETKTNEFMGTVKAIANTDAKRAANDTLAVSKVEVPQIKFLEIPIPSQFNDHNLELRVIDYDPIRATVTKEEKELYGEKKSNAKKFGGFMKAAGGAMLAAQAGTSNSALLSTDDMGEYLPAVLAKTFEANGTAASMVGKWFGYDHSAESKWDSDFKLISERGLYNASAEDIAKAKESGYFSSKLAGKGFDLINSTYVLAINLRFRSNQAVVAESEALAQGLFGDVAKLAGAAASAAAGEGFQVQAVTYLYKLAWNDEISQRFATDIFGNNATLDDLMASGLCKLEFVGHDKASCGVRQSILNTTPESELIKRATGRAIDNAICKLQSKYEQFRTIAPIRSVDADGTIHAGIGLKEGLVKGDKYEVLEPQEDPETGKMTYKAVATVEPIPGKIWDNRFGAAEELADNDKDTDSEAVALGMSAFKGKKGQDYTGYYLRLKKKK